MINRERFFIFISSMLGGSFGINFGYTIIDITYWFIVFAITIFLNILYILIKK